MAKGVAVVHDAEMDDVSADGVVEDGGVELDDLFMRWHGVWVWVEEFR